MIPAQFDLSSLNGTNGFTLNGINYGGYSGASVSDAGDINGDGIADIIIGAPNALYFAGQSYVVFGGKTSFPAQFSLTSLNGANGFALNGINSGDQSGASVNGAGDINGDGIDDVIIGAPDTMEYEVGQSYIVFGSNNGFPAQFNLASLNGKNGFAINGINPDDSNGSVVSGAGDVNGDGIDDIIIGARGALSGAGQSYVVFGSKNTFPEQFNLANLNGANGFALNGVNKYDSSGASVNGAGDINGDGIDDVIIGAPYALNDVGQSYVVFGSKDSFPAQFNLANLNGANGFALNGIPDTGSNPYTGSSVSGAGDFNGDGIDDIIIGAPYALNKAGQSYVVFGGSTGFPAQLNLVNLNGRNGFALNGINGGSDGDKSGYSVSGAGDINGDGIADIIIGAPSNLVNDYAGQSYVVFGSKNGFPEQFSLANLNGRNGFALNGINGGSNGDQSGSSVSGAGDTNYDGIDDIIIGAPYALNKAGQSYVVFGRNYSPSPSTTPTFSPISSITPSSTPSSTPTPSVTASALPVPTVTPSPSINPSPENNGYNLGELLGGIAGGVFITAAAAGLFVYGKAHGWWCAGQQHDAYHEMA